MEWWQLFLAVLATAATGGITFGLFWANAKNKYGDAENSNYEQALSSYKVLVEAKDHQITQGKLELKEMRELHAREIKELRELHTQSQKDIGRLQGQVDAYSKLPLSELADDMKTISQLQLLIANALKIEGADQLVAASRR